MTLFKSSIRIFPSRVSLPKSRLRKELGSHFAPGRLLELPGPDRPFGQAPGEHPVGQRPFKGGG